MLTIKCYFFKGLPVENLNFIINYFYKSIIFELFQNAYDLPMATSEHRKNGHCTYNLSRYQERFKSIDLSRSFNPDISFVPNLGHGIMNLSCNMNWSFSINRRREVINATIQFVPNLGHGIMNLSCNVQCIFWAFNLIQLQ